MKRILSVLVAVCMFPGYISASGISAGSYAYPYVEAGCNIETNVTGNEAVGDIGEPLVFVLNGSVKSTGGEPIEYASVVFTDKAGNYVSGVVTGDGGVFAVELAQGAYVMEVSYIGYKTLTREVAADGDIALGDIMLEPEELKVDEVVVRGNTVVHRADGYSLMLSGSKLTEGRNVREALRYVPGLWIDNEDNIKINGQGGIQVMINDRIVTMTSGELLRYLETIDADDVKSIDVVRSAGAAYDASVGGAVLKINLRNRKTDGMFGSLSMSYERADSLDTRYMPSVWFNMMRGKFSMSTGFTYNRSRGIEHNIMDSYYKDKGDTIATVYNRESLGENYSYSLRGVYTIDKRNSVGLDYNMGFYNGHGFDEVSDSRFYGKSYGDKVGYMGMRSDSPAGRIRTYDLSVNYRNAFDTLGSYVLVVADWHRSRSSESSHTVSTTRFDGVEMFDYLRDASDRSNDFYTVRADVNHTLSSKWSLGYGVKYSYSDMSSDFGYYTSSDDIGWHYDIRYSDDYRYKEGIAAGYATASGRMGRFSLTAGLRVENTDIRPRSLHEGESYHRNYTDLFPSASFSYVMDKQGKYMAALNYRRSISRPSFGILNPKRTPIDNVTYAVGNPYLSPSYAENLALNFTLDGKYTLGVNYVHQKDMFGQVAVPDTENPDIILYKMENIDKSDMLLATAYLPFMPFKWWNINLNVATGTNSSSLSGVKRSKLLYSGQVTTLFSLPKKWSLELNGQCTGNFVQGNMVLDRPVANLDGAIKKNFLDGKLIMSLDVKNIVSTKMNILIDEPSYARNVKLAGNSIRRFGVTLKYNFKAGKNFSAAQVVKGNAEDAGRFN